MSKISRLRYILAFVLVGFLSACAREEAPPSEEAPPPTVSVATVQSEQVTLTRRLPGRTRSFLVAEVRPQVSGVVQERLFTEGASVEKGDILYQLDDAIYEADVASARASAVRARATLQLAELNAERVLDLFEKNAVSQQERDNAVAEADQAEADLNLAEAKLRSAEVLLGYSSIKAPISGRIGRSAVTQGALVTQNQSEPLATVQQLDPIYVDVAHSAREMLALQKAIASGELEEADLPATILLEDGSEFEHKGKVAFSEVTVDPTTGSSILRIVVPNPDHLLLPGMYVRAVIGAGVREQGILVPQKAVIRDPSGRTMVMIVGDNNVVEGRVIQVSRSIGNNWLVDAGLIEGDRVVTTGLQQIQPGIEVKVAESSEETASSEEL